MQKWELPLLTRVLRPESAGRRAEKSSFPFCKGQWIRYWEKGSSMEVLKIGQMWSLQGGRRFKVLTPPQAENWRLILRREKKGISWWNDTRCEGGRGSHTESSWVKCKLTFKGSDPPHPSLRSPHHPVSASIVQVARCTPSTFKIRQSISGESNQSTRTSQRVYYTFTAHPHTHTQTSHTNTHMCTDVTRITTHTYTT